MPMAIGRFDMEEQAPRVSVPVTRYGKEFDRGAEPAPLQLTVLILAIQKFDRAVRPPAISARQASRVALRTSVQLRHIFQQALQWRGFADGALDPVSKALRTGHVHFGGVLESFEHGYANPSTRLRDRQRAQQRYAALVALHEDDDVTVLEITVVALRLEVGRTRYPQSRKAMQPKGVGVALSLCDDENSPRRKPSRP